MSQVLVPWLNLGWPASSKADEGGNAESGNRLTMVRPAGGLSLRPLPPPAPRY
jgi:hypothetical protein